MMMTTAMIVVVADLYSLTFKDTHTRTHTNVYGIGAPLMATIRTTDYSWAVTLPRGNCPGKLGGRGDEFYRCVVGERRWERTYKGP